MKHLFALTLTWISLNVSCQPLSKPTPPQIDSNLSKKISIANFCLCQTTLTDLKKLDPQLIKVNVEEMDLCGDGFVQDARFTNGIGYHSEKFPGIIFQKDPDDDYISKFRLTKDFMGKLPDGTPIDMHHLLAKDVLTLYPAYADTWRSRGCSNFWNLTNDTLSFYVKIDKSRQPQYPVDEAYYANQPIEGIDLTISCYTVFAKANHRLSQLFNDPIFFLDSVNVTRFDLQKIQPTDISTVSVYKDSNAIKLIGPQGAGGVVYIETKAFVKSRYWAFLKRKSPEYLKAVPSPASDSSVCYLINGKLLGPNSESDLLKINDDNFLSLTVIDEKHISIKTK